jgi:hypothetical protein
MTLAEKLENLALIAQSFASMDRTNALRIETFRHKAMEATDRLADGMAWAENERAWEVSFYVGGGGVLQETTPSGIGKTLEQAVDLCGARAAEILSKQAGWARKEHSDSLERAAWLDGLAARLIGQNVEGP